MEELSKNKKDIETNQINQVIERIKRALKMASKKEILEYIYTLQANYSLSNLEFFDLIGKIYKMNPRFFMISIYPEIRVKFNKIYGDQGMRVMDKHILERYSLNWDEKIIYEFNGKISGLVEKHAGMRVKGRIYITNQKIIAQGTFWFLDIDTSIKREIKESWIGSQRRKVKHAFLMRKMSTYGYHFPTYNFNRLKMGKRKLRYYSGKNLIKITPSEMENHRDKLFAILDQFQTRN